MVHCNITTRHPLPPAPGPTFPAPIAPSHLTCHRIQPLVWCSTEVIHEEVVLQAHQDGDTGRNTDRQTHTHTHTCTHTHMRTHTVMLLRVNSSLPPPSHHHHHHHLACKPNDFKRAPPTQFHVSLLAHKLAAQTFLRIICGSAAPTYKPQHSPPAYSGL